MASFLTDRLTRALASDSFSWSLSPYLRVLLIGEQVDPYAPSESDPYSSIESLVALEPTVTNYERQTITSPNASTSFLTHSTLLELDDVLFEALGDPGDRILGAWVYVDRFASDATAWPLAWLDFRDGEGLGVELTGGDFVIHFPTGGLATIAKG